MSDSTQLSREELFKENLETAKLILMQKSNFAFFSSLLYKFKLQFIPKGTIKLDSVSKTIFINPEWFNEEPNEIKATSLAHVILGYALQHDLRLGEKNPELFQKASDQVINNILDNSEFTLPFKAKEDLNIEFSEKKVEDVYTYMEEEYIDEHGEPPPPSPNGDKTSNEDEDNSPPSSNGTSENPFNDDLMFNNSVSSNEQNQRNQDLQEANLSNDMANGTQDKSAGSLSHALENMFKTINDKNKLNWKHILAKYVDTIVRGERSFHKLDRRMLPLGFYLPNSSSEAHIEKITVAFDVSGSVSHEETLAFITELQNIKTVNNPEILQMITFNSDIVENILYEQHQKIQDVTLKTGGGTNLNPVFNHLNKPENKPNFLIVFSDLYCGQITDKPDYEVIWVCINNDSAEVNFGELLHITSEELINGN